MNGTFLIFNMCGKEVAFLQSLWTNLTLWTEPIVVWCSTRQRCWIAARAPAVARDFFGVMKSRDIFISGYRPRDSNPGSVVTSGTTTSYATENVSDLDTVSVA